MGKGKMAVTVVGYLLIVSAFMAVAYGASFATTTVAQLIPPEREHTIVIDAGHGGVDGGATSCTGIPESQFNLEISLKLEDLFHLLGFKTKMIRRTDISVYSSGETIAAKKISDLRNRVRLVSETDDPVLISIHQNTFPDSRYHGAQVFYSESGKEFASFMQHGLVANIHNNNNRTAKRADGVYLMQHVDCVGILIECGFLSNPEEEALLRDKDYQKKLCAIIASATAEFLTK
jgi:N-acetylmuramoyl-L-alanine amidase